MKGNHEVNFGKKMHKHFSLNFGHFSMTDEYGDLM